MRLNRLLFLALFLLSNLCLAQDEDIDRWDNWFLMGQKIVFGGEGNWKHSHELQWRAKEDVTALDQVFYEAVITYSPNATWEIVPDFRMARKNDVMDFRPGFGIVRKDYFKWAPKGQFVHQLKYQYDINNRGDGRHGLRYVINYNQVINESLVVSGLIGGFYRWSGDFNGVEFVRFGPSIAYVFNEVHSLGFAPLIGVGNLGFDENGEKLGWVGSFTPLIQLIIRVKKDYKFTPSKYINF